MKLLFLVFITSMLFNGAYAQEELVAKVKSKLDRVRDYQADGKMTLDVSFIDVPPCRVKVYYKSPDKFRVKKEGGISILPKGGVSVNIASLLGNREYDMLPGKDVMIGGVQTKVVKLLPRDDNSDIVLTTLYIEEARHLVRKAAVTTKENGSFEVELEYGSYADWGLPDKVVFSFNTKDYKLPKGITFEYEKGGSKKPLPANKKGKVEILYSSYSINKGIDEKIFKTED